MFSTEPALPMYPIILCALFCQSCTRFLLACVPVPGSGLKLISYDRVSIADKRWQKRLLMAISYGNGVPLLMSKAPAYVTAWRVFPFSFEMGNFHLRTDYHITTNADIPPGPVG